MNQTMQEWDEWLQRRIQAYICKKWKKPKTKVRNLMKLEVAECFARMATCNMRGYWLRSIREL